MSKQPESHWWPLGHPAPDRLTAARLEAHWAMQVVSATADAMLDAAKDDSHSNAEWLARHRALAGHVLDHENPFRLALRIEDLTLLFITSSGEGDGDRRLRGYDLTAKTLDDAIAWVSNAIEERTGAPPRRPIVLRDYDMPDHPVRDGAAFEADDSAALEELSRWYANADAVLRPLRESTDGAMPVACWPHHFDIATLILLDQNKEPREAPQLSVGLSPGDGTYAEPYWYVSYWPKSDADERPQLPAGGVWQAFGAALPGSALVGDGSAEEQQEQLEEFLQAATDVGRALIAANLAREA